MTAEGAWLVARARHEPPPTTRTAPTTTTMLMVVVLVVGAHRWDTCPGTGRRDTCKSWILAGRVSAESSVCAAPRPRPRFWARR
ncbi:unnamed protein product [Lampetra fluviatilis]